jgi:hypothetical protein
MPEETYCTCWFQQIFAIDFLFKLKNTIDFVVTLLTGVQNMDLLEGGFDYVLNVSDYTKLKNIT